MIRQSISLCFALLVAAPAHADAPAERIAFEFAGMRSSNGAVLCSVYQAEKAWLKSSYKQARAVITDKQATCVFDALPPGNYAVAVFHDENGNNKLDTNMFGAPKEGTGASNNARGKMSAPKWKDAKFDYTGAAIKQVITITY